MLFQKNKKVIDFISLQIKNDVEEFFDNYEKGAKSIEIDYRKRNMLRSGMYVNEIDSFFTEQLNSFIKKEIDKIFNMQDELNIKFKPIVWQESKTILKQYVSNVIEEYKSKRNKIIDALNLDDEKHQFKSSFKVDLCKIDELISVAEKKTRAKEDKPEVKYQRRTWYIAVLSLIVSIVSIVVSVVVSISVYKR